MAFEDLEKSMDRALVKMKNRRQLGRTDFLVRRAERVEQRQGALQNLHAVTNDQRIRDVGRR